jgi:hypothetical protein
LPQPLPLDGRIAALIGASAECREAVGEWGVWEMRHLYLTGMALGMGALFTWFAAVALEQAQLKSHHVAETTQVPPVKPMHASAPGSMFIGSRF